MYVRWSVGQDTKGNNVKLAVSIFMHIFHKNINKTLKRFSVSQNHPDHKEKIRKMSVKYSSMRI